MTKRQTKEPTVKWVKTWRDLPSNPASNSIAQTSGKGVIYAVKGKATKADIEHEKGHIKLGHLKRKTITPLAHVKEEIDATYYAFKRTGQPTHIYSILSGIYNDLAFREYSGKYKTPQEILRVIRNALKRHPIPITWKRDFAKLVDAVRTKEGF